MTFINDRCFILRKGNKEIFHIYNYLNSLRCNISNSSNQIISTSDIYNKSLLFSDFYFDLYKDKLYGIVNDEGIFLIESNNDEFTKEKLCTYDSDNFSITMPYIKVFENNMHIIYYVYHVNNPFNCALFHQYKCDDIWTEYKIDFINFQVLNEFTVCFNNNTPTVFYMNLVNGFEQVFSSRFNTSTLSWSKPIQITKSPNKKLYLSVIKDNINFYHISYSEKLDSKYSIKFLNGYLLENEFDISQDIILSDSDLNLYPSIMKDCNSNIYVMWVNFNKLYTTKSIDLGKTWSDINIDEISQENNFTRCKFVSEYYDDYKYTTDNLFNIDHEIGFIGI